MGSPKLSCCSIALAGAFIVGACTGSRSGDVERTGGASAQQSGSGDTEPLACTAAAGDEDFAGPGAMTGRLSNTDPVENGRLKTFDDQPVPPRSCTQPPPVPDVADANTQFHYDAYTFRNRSSSTACVSATVLSENHHPDPFQVAVYLGSFDPTDIQKNYLSDEGRQDGYVYGQTFSVPAMTDFVLVISGAVSDAPDPDGSSYRFAVGGCGAAEETGGVDAGGGTVDAGGEPVDAGGEPVEGGGGKAW